MVTPIDTWFRHQVTVERFTGSGTYGDEWDTTTDQPAWVDDSTRRVVDQDGAETVSQTTVTLPVAVGYIPPGSYITLPAVFGGRRAKVISCTVADGAGLPTPDHVKVHLE